MCSQHTSSLGSCLCRETRVTEILFPLLEGSGGEECGVLVSYSPSISVSMDGELRCTNERTAIVYFPPCARGKQGLGCQSQSGVCVGWVGWKTIISFLPFSHSLSHACTHTHRGLKFWFNVKQKNETL